MSKLFYKINNFILGIADRYERFILQRKLNNENIKVGTGLLIDKYFSLELPHERYLFIIGNNVIVRKFCNITLHQNASLTIADNVFFNNYCSVNCLGNISIGENTLFGEGVKLYDHNHNYYYKNNTLTVDREKFKQGFIKIGKNCWIGSNVTVLNNVEIGDNVIIGANALIHKSVPAGTTVKLKSSFLIEGLDGE